MAAASAEVDWGNYFLSIKKYCPWSLAAWNKGLIDIVQGYKQILPLGQFHARIYIVELNPRRLKKLCEKLDAGSEEDEWLWSHPRYASQSTPVPVLIQQNRKMLNDIRSKLGDTYASTQS